MYTYVNIYMYNVSCGFTGDNDYLDSPAFTRHQKELNVTQTEVLMSRGKRYTGEFKAEAVKHIVEWGYAVRCWPLSWVTI
jgi:hypothetical protein